MTKPITKQQIQNIQIDLEKLKQARIEKGWSQSDVARQLNVPRHHIHYYEKGIALPLIPFLKLVFLYKKPLKYFLVEN